MPSRKKLIIYGYRRRKWPSHSQYRTPSGYSHQNLKAACLCPRWMIKIEWVCGGVWKILTYFSLLNWRYRDLRCCYRRLVGWSRWRLWERQKIFPLLLISLLIPLYPYCRIRYALIIHMLRFLLQQMPISKHSWRVHRSLLLILELNCALLVSRDQIFMTESIDAVASFLESFENLISTRPVTDALHDIEGYLEKGLNLFSLHITRIIPQKNRIIKTPHSKMLWWTRNSYYRII